MSENYAKLACDIVFSSMWSEDAETCKIWITILALKDKDGLLKQNLTGISRVTGIPLAKVQSAVDFFQQPDPHSSSLEEEGRRLVKCDHGYRVVNHFKYRGYSQSEDKRESDRIRQQIHREKLSMLESCHDNAQAMPKHCSSNAPSNASSIPAAPVKSDFKGKDDKSTYSPESRVALHYLNEQSGKRFRECQSSLEPINARLKESGVDIDGVKKMIERQCRKWKGTSMEEYLRPQTLFGKEKFDSYYASREMPIQNEKSKSNPQFIDRSLDTQNEGVAEKYAGLG